MFSLMNSRTIDVIVAMQIIEEFVRRLPEKKYMFWAGGDTFDPETGWSMAATLYLLEFLLRVPEYRVIGPEADIGNATGLRARGYSPTSTELEVRTILRDPEECCLPVYWGSE